MIYIDKYESRHHVRMYSRIGRRAPLHCTAVAKVLRRRAARGAAARRSPRPSTYPRLTANTITDADGVPGRAGHGCADRGYAVDNAEHEDFIHCVAAPIRGARGEVLAADVDVRAAGAARLRRPARPRARPARRGASGVRRVRLPPRRRKFDGRRSRSTRRRAEARRRRSRRASARATSCRWPARSRSTPTTGEIVGDTVTEQTRQTFAQRRRRCWRPAARASTTS